MLYHLDIKMHGISISNSLTLLCTILRERLLTSSAVLAIEIIKRRYSNQKKNSKKDNYCSRAKHAWSLFLEVRDMQRLSFMS
jgi:hypothetical protein